MRALRTRTTCHATAVTTAMIALFAAQQRAAAQSTPTATVGAREFAAVRPVLAGTRALETVAYLDRFVRWPGNPGFDSSIAHVAARLAAAGYVNQATAKATDRLTYRVERYPMSVPAWEPLAATVRISESHPLTGMSGAELARAVELSLASSMGLNPVLSFASNRNMLATNSFSTPTEGVTAELVRVTAVTAAALDAALNAANVAGKIVMADGRIGQLFTEAVVKRGALGVMAYSMPAYTQPEKNIHSIQFSSIPYDSARKSWGVLLSFNARRELLEALTRGAVRLHVQTRSHFVSPATELAIVAEVRGSEAPDERFVYSAHVQEPGANDDASGVGALAEMARTLAELTKSGQVDPKRTITMLWGQEIRVTDRYLKQDSVRLRGVRWGISLDMVGEDTEKTGGTFLIEKMPDPSAIWTRGEDKHSEWGGRPMTEEQMKPHYFNDFLLARCLDQARATGWVVKTNPFEGGSDHTAFLNNGKPGVLFWHFTDQFYHTDSDRIEMVSPTTLQNVGISALVSGLVLASANGATARAIVDELQRAAIARLETETALSKEAIAKGADQAAERHIVEVWGKWYVDALRTAVDIEVGGSRAQTTAAIDSAVKAVESRTRELVRSITGE
ncbi:MAG: M28 family peptidase [Gemmatimonadetes bacterium]|nr:M28 family peptidase [Gemmatimonadota bacterium]